MKKSKTKILLVVDMQAGFLTEKNKHIYDNIYNIVNFNDYEYIFATKFINTKKENSNYLDILNYDFMTNDNETKILLENINYIEIKKYGYALPLKHLNQIKSIYKDNKNKEIHIVGTDYDSCVLAIGFQLFDIGLIPRFYYDLIGTHSSNSVDFENFQKVYKKNFGQNCFIYKK